MTIGLMYSNNNSLFGTSSRRVKGEFEYLLKALKKAKSHWRCAQTFHPTVKKKSGGYGETRY